MYLSWKKEIQLSNGHFEFSQSFLVWLFSSQIDVYFRYASFKNALDLLKHLWELLLDRSSRLSISLLSPLAEPVFSHEIRTNNRLHFQWSRNYRDWFVFTFLVSLHFLDWNAFSTKLFLTKLFDSCVYFVGGWVLNDITFEIATTAWCVAAEADLSHKFNFNKFKSRVY